MSPRVYKGRISNKICCYGTTIITSPKRKGSFFLYLDAYAHELTKFQS